MGPGSLILESQARGSVDPIEKKEGKICKQFYCPSLKAATRLSVNVGKTTMFLPGA